MRPRLVSTLKCTSRYIGFRLFKAASLRSAPLFSALEDRDADVRFAGTTGTRLGPALKVLANFENRFSVEKPQSQ